MDEMFDFVVVGSGGGSGSAALVMRSAGKSVVVLEKADKFGGTTARSGGVMWVPNNSLSAAEGVHDSYEKSMEYMEATAGQSADAPGTSVERRSAYVKEAPKMVDFLISQGIKLRVHRRWPDYYDNLPGGLDGGRCVVADLFNTAELGPWQQSLNTSSYFAYPAKLTEMFAMATFKHSWAGKLALAKVGLRGAVAKLTGKHWVTAGTALQGRMLQAQLKAGVDIRLDSPVSSLIVENDRVVGVATQKDGRPWRIGARLGVLVNAGGFAQNQEMVEKYIPGASVKWTAVVPGDTGEMILEMMRLGAATGQMNEMVGNQLVVPPGKENFGDGLDYGASGGQIDFTKPHSIVVDQSGERYMNECGSYMEFCQKLIKRNEQVPAIPSWWVVDSQYMKNYFFIATLPGSSKPKEWFESGFVKRADTLEELARETGMDPTQLKATVEKFNADARAGKDTLFHRGEREYDKWLGDPYHKGSPTLGPLEVGPFYAAPIVPANVGTCGGVVTDSSARVLKEDGTPIPGLYATGNSTATVMGRYYVGAGSSIGPSFTWGYVAARHAAGVNQ